MQSAHDQRRFAVRFDWGLGGAAAIGRDADVVVLVDVLSFTTTVSVALDRGMTVLPYRWRDDDASAFASANDAVLASGRSTGGLSLSPMSIRQHPRPPERLVLPSPNGSAIAHHVQTTGVAGVAACLRNATAVAEWLSKTGAARVAFVAAGEQWPDGALRPAVEDAWGAGAVITLLARSGRVNLSPEAESAAAAYVGVAGRELDALTRCASGRELIELGYPADVEIAAEINEISTVPLLADGSFTRWRGP